MVERLCSVRSTQPGFVTLKGNQGTTYLQAAAGGPRSVACCRQGPCGVHGLLLGATRGLVGFRAWPVYRPDSCVGRLAGVLAFHRLLHRHGQEDRGPTMPCRVGQQLQKSLDYEDGNDGGYADDCTDDDGDDENDDETDEDYDDDDGHAVLGMMMMIMMIMTVMVMGIMLLMMMIRMMMLMVMVMLLMMIRMIMIMMMMGCWW